MDVAGGAFDDWWLCAAAQKILQRRVSVVSYKFSFYSNSISTLI